MNGLHTNSLAIVTRSCLDANSFDSLRLDPACFPIRTDVRLCVFQSFGNVVEVGGANASSDHHLFLSVDFVPFVAVIAQHHDLVQPRPIRPLAGFLVNGGDQSLHMVGGIVALGVHQHD